MGRAYMKLTKITSKKTTSRKKVGKTNGKRKRVRKYKRA